MADDLYSDAESARRLKAPCGVPSLAPDPVEGCSHEGRERATADPARAQTWKTTPASF